LHFSPNNRDDILSPVVFLTRKLEKKEKKKHTGIAAEISV
jgi:hypothetical protein